MGKIIALLLQLAYLEEDTVSNMPTERTISAALHLMINLLGEAERMLKAEFAKAA